MKRIGILVVAYNAASTLAPVLDRIPPAFRPRISEVLVSDDGSVDGTYDVGVAYAEVVRDLPVTVIRQPRNLGYGGNQKVGYRWAIERGFDVVVLLHGDGQYAPELLPTMVEPLERDGCDAVLGSRMMVPGAARRGGMPLYKYAGNRVLSTFQNAVVGTALTEWHSGYRAYRVAALRDIPFEDNADGFHFDTQMILQLHEAGKRIVEVPIPTYYGHEICHVNGVAYARDVVTDVVRYRLHTMGLGTGATAFAGAGAGAAYELKTGDTTSHGRILAWLAARPPGRVLDLGCSDGALGQRLRAAGHEVTGVDVTEVGAVRARLDRFVAADLDAGIPSDVGDGYDLVLAADVLEHVRRPDRVLAEAKRCLAPGGSLVASIPNFAHWYPRARVALGRFDYDRREILDQGHVRFFTRRSFERLLDRTGWSVRHREAVGTPVEVAGRGRGAEVLQRVDGVAVTLRPTLFAYQFLFELEPRSAT